MRVVWLFALVGATLLTPAQAGAQEACEGATTTALMRRCAQAKLEQAELQLDRVLEDYRTSLRADRIPLLEESQELWEHHRAGYCRFVSSEFAGGSLRPVVELTCRQEVTDARTAQLQRQLQMEQEGDPPVEEGVGYESGPTARNNRLLPALAVLATEYPAEAGGGR